MSQLIPTQDSKKLIGDQQAEIAQLKSRVAELTNALEAQKALASSSTAEALQVLSLLLYASRLLVVVVVVVRLQL